MAAQVNGTMAFVGADVDIMDRLSDVVGALVILGSFTVKVPVILNVHRYKSSDGLSSTSLYTQSLAITCASMYNFLKDIPLSLWAESLSVLVQNFVLVALCWYYSKATTASHVAAAVGTYVALSLAMLYVPSEILWFLPMAATVVGISAQLPQIKANFNNGHTGALSAITQWLNVAGIFARVFTTLQAAEEPVVLLSLCVSAVMHCTLLAQIVLLREATNAAMNKKKLQ